MNARKRYDKKNPVVSFRVDIDLYNRLHSTAGLTGLTIKQVLIEGLKTRLDELDKVWREGDKPKPKKKKLFFL